MASKNDLRRSLRFYFLILAADFIATRYIQMIHQIKSNYLKITTGAALLLLCGASNASIEEQFSLCASKAIAAQSISAKKISVELPATNAKAMDHDSSYVTHEYIMELVNPRTGEGLGKVSCRVSRSGDIKAVRLLSKQS